MYSKLKKNEEKRILYLLILLLTTFDLLCVYACACIYIYNEFVLLN